MTDVVLRCKYPSSTIELGRYNPPKPADTLHISYGTFHLPTGRVLTMKGTTYGNEITVLAVGGDILIDGVRLPSGHQQLLTVRVVPITLKAA